MFLRLFIGVSRMFKGCINEVVMVFQEGLKRKCWQCFSKFQDCYMVVSRVCQVFQRYLMEVSSMSQESLRG